MLCSGRGWIVEGRVLSKALYIGNLHTGSWIQNLEGDAIVKGYLMHEVVYAIPKSEPGGIWDLGPMGIPMAGGCMDVRKS